MAQAQVGKIKLVSMEIVDFKTLQKGTISWDFSPDGHFGIIAVQDFVGNYLFSKKKGAK